MLVQGVQRAALGDHRLRLARDDLGRHRAADDVADAADDLAGVAVLLGEQRRVGGGAGQDAPARDLLHLGDGPGVDEEPHGRDATRRPGST
jgi:hypothetical protein